MESGHPSTKHDYSNEPNKSQPNQSELDTDTLIDKRTQMLSKMNSKLSKAESALTEVCCRICFAGEPVSPEHGGSKNKNLD